IELVIRKRFSSEVKAGGHLVTSSEQPSTQMRQHLNQYREDLETLKSANREHPPFQNEQPL
ncbi:MAG: SAM-dependent methyltransferase, partial [Nitrospirales bacterium]|nr:SAM-dependent methyltransferase [Nitrospirales bacterium]